MPSIMKTFAIVFAMALLAGCASVTQQRSDQMVFVEGEYTITVDLTRLRTFPANDGDTIYGAAGVIQGAGVIQPLFYNVAGEYCATGEPKTIWLTEINSQEAYAETTGVDPKSNAARAFDAICAAIGKVPTIAVGKDDKRS